MPTPVAWTPSLISRFWDGIARTPALDGLSFARLAGPTLVEFVGPWLSKDEQCLDFGGGSGHLVRALVDAGYPTASFEPSRARARIVDRLLQGEALFLGTVDQLDRRQFDSIVCTEVIEHVRPYDTEAFVQALVRRMKPGGRLLLTTPNSENLKANEAYCPVCDSTFHRWQHQRNWTLQGLREFLARYGLETEWVGLVGFNDVNVVREFNLRRRLGEPWPWCRIEPDGSATPVLAIGDHIAIVCRLTNAEEMNLSHPDQLLAAGCRAAQRAGDDPIVVSPKSDVGVEARTLIVARDLFDPDGTNREPTRDDSSALVFPAALDVLEREICAGRLPSTSAAWVFEGSKWRRVSRNRSVNVEPIPRPSPDRARSYARHQVKRAAMRLRTLGWARRLQPALDRREDVVLEVLRSPGDFPYRMAHTVSGRVLLAIGTLGSGGAERQLINTAEGLASRGVDDVHILVNHLYDDPANSFYLNKATSIASSVRATPEHDHGVTQWALSHPEFRDALGDDLISLVLNDARAIREVSPEVVHCSLDWTNVTVGLAAVLAGVPHVFLSGRNLSPWHFGFFQWFMYPAYRALARCPQVQLLNNSISGRNDYAAWLRIEQDSIKLLRNGLHAGDFAVSDDDARGRARHLLEVPADAPVVMGAFRLSSEKRPLLWVDSAAQILRKVPNAHFLLCGIGAMSAEVAERVRALGLSDRLRMLGARADIQTVFAAADVVLQASLQEGTPNVLIEAQAHGLPVVTTSAFGAAEAVEDGVTGCVVRDETAAGLAQATVRVLDDRVFRCAVRAAGPRFVESHFGFDRMIDDTLAVYAASGVDWALDLMPFEKRYLAYARLESIQHDEGSKWVVHIPEWVEYADGMEKPQQSRLLLLEDGKPLGPAHTEHVLISKHGGGAYSHWGQVLAFSTSDGSDPTTNGAVYLAVIPREDDAAPLRPFGRID